ncbi:MAG: hypothetical protein H6631_10375 [Anaerolineaceae bacterium]|nr:hypothetical protein [Anaerolineaceae bacterium]
MAKLLSLWLTSKLFQPIGLINKVGLKVVRHHFINGIAEIRVAVGFFTVRGYNLIRKSAKGKKLFILVGVKEPDQKRVEFMLISTVYDNTVMSQCKTC